MNIEELNKLMKQCSRCRLSETRINTLCGEGDLNAEIMLIALAPGENEDREDKMFIGASGKVLDELLFKAEIKRNNIYMTNLIKCTLPKNRRPKQAEIEICSRYLDEEIELINPELLVPLGYYASKYILQKYSYNIQSKTEFRKVYGNIYSAGIRKIFPLHHPAAILYNSSYKEGITKNYCRINMIYEDLHKNRN